MTVESKRTVTAITEEQRTAKPVGITDYDATCTNHSYKVIPLRVWDDGCVLVLERHCPRTHSVGNLRCPRVVNRCPNAAGPNSDNTRSRFATVTRLANDTTSCILGNEA